MKGIDYRRHPERYRVGRGEQGVFHIEPYKRELLPHWRFRTPAVARASAAKIHAMFLDYKRRGDFVGMDMARKYLQMGFTRARRYANRGGGPQKAAAAEIFRRKWRAAAADRAYLRLKAAHLAAARRRRRR